MSEQRGKELARYIESLSDFTISIPGYPYNHMGATIIDAILQAGLTWETTVKPRIERVQRYEEARTTTGFKRIINRIGIKELIDWLDDEKPSRIISIVGVFQQELIETEKHLYSWLSLEVNVKRLLNQRGIGPKTLDYFRMLAGIPSIAIDRHLKQFVSNAGIYTKGYFDVQEVISSAANHLGIENHVIDHSIWKYMSGKNKREITR